MEGWRPRGKNGLNSLMLVNRVMWGMTVKTVSIVQYNFLVQDCLLTRIRTERVGTNYAKRVSVYVLYLL